MIDKIKLYNLDRSHLHYLVKWINQKPQINIARYPYMTNIRQQEIWADIHLENNNEYNFIFLTLTDGEVGYGCIENINWISKKAEMFVCLETSKQTVEQVSEAYGALTTFGFKDLGLNKMATSILVETPALIKLLEKKGFVKEVRKRQHYFSNASYHHVLEMAIFVQEATDERIRDTSNTSRKN